MERPSSPALSTVSNHGIFSSRPRYHPLKDLLAGYTSAEGARGVLRALLATMDPAAPEEEHAVTAEAKSYLREFRVAVNDIAVLPEALHKLTSVGSTLEIPEIEAVQSFLSQVEGLRVRWKDDREKFPRLAATAHRLPDLRELGKQLGRAVH